MKKIYNKLVRDRIPSIIQDSNKTCQTRILNDEEYIYYLKLKLLEESQEVNHAANNQIVEEIADVMEVIDALITSISLIRFAPK